MPFILPALKHVPDEEQGTSEFKKRLANGDLSGQLDVQHDLDQVCAITADNWLGALDDLTFRSQILPMTRTQAEDLFHHRSSSTHIQGLIDAIDKVMKDMDCTGYFVKLVTRSPKDASLQSARFQKLYAEELQQLSPQERASDNGILRALMSAHIGVLRVSSGEEAVELLLASGRIEEDLDFLLGPDGDSVQLALVIREWAEVLPLWGEWRGFVRRVGDSLRLVALSQYYHLVCFDELTNDTTRSAAVSAISECFREVVRPRLLATDNSMPPSCSQARDVICDFAVSPPIQDGGAWKVSVIELNPWGSGVGHCMFERIRDASLLSLKDASAVPLDFPPLVRYVEAPLKNVRAHLTTEVRRLVDETGRAWR